MLYLQSEFCVSLTSDVVGVVETVAVEFTGLRLFGWRTLLLLTGLTEWVSSPLPSTVLTAGLRTQSTHSFSYCLHEKQKGNQ